MSRSEKNETFYTWIHNDITWCGNTCSNKECERNLSNRIPDGGFFSMSLFEGTETCPMYKEKQNEEST